MCKIFLCFILLIPSLLFSVFSFQISYLLDIWDMWLSSYSFYILPHIFCFFILFAVYVCRVLWLYLIVFGFGLVLVSSFKSLWEYWLDFFSSFFSSTSCFCFHGEYFVYFAILILLFFFICPTDYKLFAHF